MTFLAPVFFYAALGVAAAVAALHFIVTRQLRAGMLPTARFVPDMPATATARATRPSDLLLMLLRVLIVLATGAALAKPILRPSRGAEARLILADVSRSAQDSIGLRDSVRALLRSNDALVLFDSSARVIGGDARDSLDVIRPSMRRGNISAALLAAMRAARELRERADSIELVIVSPVGAEETDAATESVRKLWPGNARIVRVAPPADTASLNIGLETVARPGDPMQVSAAMARKIPGANALILRDDAAPGENAGNGRALVMWPATSRPPHAIPRVKRDTIGGVVAGDALVVAAFERQWTFPADSIRGAEVVGRWIDGEPAAVEWSDADGCARSVGVPVSPVGDLVIRDDFIHLVGALSSDCAMTRARRLAGAQTVAMLAGSGGLAHRAAFKARSDARSSLAPWLLTLALFGAVAELFMRRRIDGSVVSANQSTLNRKRAA